MDIQTWYGSSVPVPTYRSSRYPYFAASCIGLVSSIFRDRLAQSVRVRFTEMDTASADQTNRLINISSNFLVGMFPDVEERVDSNTALSVILGIIVHEAAHFAYSPSTLLPFADYVKKHTTCNFDKNIAMALGNIVEDIFIEDAVCKNVPLFSWMLIATNKMIAPEEMQERVIAQSQEINSAPEDGTQLATAMNVILTGKVRDSIDSTPFITGLFNQGRTAVDCRSLLARQKLTLSLYNQLMVNMSECEDGQGEQILGDAISITLDHSEEMKETKGGKMSSEEEGEEEEERSEEFTGFHDINSLLEGSVVVKLERKTMESDWCDTVTFIEKLMPMAALPVPLDKRYARLAEIARQRATVNKPYGEDRNRGTNIRKLYRIATDQKIFSEKIVMREHKPMQVVILVDFSGSMQATVDGKARGTSVSRLEAACSAAAGAAKGLAESRCEVAVYGHTACVDEASNVVVWKFKGFNDPLDSMMYRINHTEHHLTKENKDGYAIQYVGRKFTSRTRKKLLIVISDGSPLAPHYHGTAANEHTQQQVDNLRKQGIEVLSISISDDARFINDRIYGKKNNIYNQSPHVIEEVIKALL